MLGLIPQTRASPCMGPSPPGGQGHLQPQVWPGAGVPRATHKWMEQRWWWAPEHGDEQVHEQHVGDQQERDQQEDDQPVGVEVGAGGRVLQQQRMCGAVHAGF